MQNLAYPFTPFAQSIYEQTGRRLFTPANIDAGLPEDLSDLHRQALTDTLAWLRNFIMKPHPNLGRPGAVCPYVASAIDEGLLYLSVGSPADPLNHATLYEEMDVYRGIFQQFTAPGNPDLANLRCILVLFPETPESVFDDPPGLKVLKSEMMLQDITIGQFHPVSNPKRLLKEKFFPVQAPTCIYVMRPFAEFDWVFIKGEREWRDIYRRKFGVTPDDGI